MNNLDARAKAIIDAARHADRPTQADRERIRRGVAMQLAAGAVAASTVAVAGTMSVAAKVGLVVATLAVVGGGSVGVAKVWHAHAARPQATRGHMVTARAPAAPGKEQLGNARGVAAEGAPLLPPPAPEDADIRLAGGDRPRKRSLVTTDGERPSVEDSLNAEVAVLARAREELRLGRPRRALEAVAEYDRRFASGVLGEERRAIAAIATCLAEPGARARMEAEAFVRSAPSSPLAARVRATCSTVRAPLAP